MFLRPRNVSWKIFELMVTFFFFSWILADVKRGEGGNLARRYNELHLPVFRVILPRLMISDGNYEAAARYH